MLGARNLNNKLIDFTGAYFRKLNYNGLYSFS